MTLNCKEVTHDSSAARRSDCLLPRIASARRGGRSIIEDAEIDALMVEASQFGERGLTIKGRVPALEHLLSFGPVAGAQDVLAAVNHASAAELVDEGDAEACPGGPWRAVGGV